MIGYFKNLLGSKANKDKEIYEYISSKMQEDVKNASEVQALNFAHTAYDAVCNLGQNFTKLKLRENMIYFLFNIFLFGMACHFISNLESEMQSMSMIKRLKWLILPYLFLLTPCYIWFKTLKSYDGVKDISAMLAKAIKERFLTTIPFLFTNIMVEITSL